jgi:hypothetical protein
MAVVGLVIAMVLSSLQLSYNAATVLVAIATVNWLHMQLYVFCVRLVYMEHPCLILIC